MNALLANKAHQLWVLIFVIVALLVVANVMSYLLLWLVAKDKDWDEFPSADDEMKDRYRGDSTALIGTVPHHAMSDEQFSVYTGFLVWITILLSGLGIEVFVWYHFLQAWCSDRETMWRFVQFIFPLMLVTALGLGLSHDFLALPILVLGLWKFGFPETLMYLYLGLFSKRNSKITRLLDFLNGAGTVIHHGAASMIVAMLVVGVIPPSRYVLNCALILAVEHWIVLVAYANKPLYAGIALVLEYYFQWIIFCKYGFTFYPCVQA